MTLVLPQIRTAIRECLAAHERRGRLQTLQSTAVEKDHRRRSTHFTLNFEDRSSYDFAIPEDSFETVMQLGHISPLVLAQLYRFEHHAISGQWETYVPVPGYRYGVMPSVGWYRNTGRVEAPEYITTYDPLMARDPGGEQLRDDIEELEYRLREVGHPVRLGYPPDRTANLVRSISSFRPLERDEERERREREEQRRRQQLTQDQYYSVMNNTFAVNRMADQQLRQLNYGYQQQVPDAFTMENLQRARARMTAEHHQRLREMMNITPHLSDGVPSAEAEKKGWELLKDHLTAEQRADLDAKKYFAMVGESGTGYHIHIGKSHNIDILDAKGEPYRTICFGPVGQLATGDVMLTQKLALELREADALRVANTYGGGVRRRHPGSEVGVNGDILQEMQENVRNAIRGVWEERQQAQIERENEHHRRHREAEARAHAARGSRHGMLGSLFGRGGGFW